MATKKKTTNLGVDNSTPETVHIVTEAATAAPVAVKEFDIDPPVRGRYHKLITDDFKEHEARGSTLPGIDYAVPVGTQVLSAHKGTVIKADTTDDSANGKYVVVRFREGKNVWEFWYLHLSKVSVKYGQQVALASTIGLSGNTGHSTGPHLHFTVKKNGKCVDPKRFY